MSKINKTEYANNPEYLSDQDFKKWTFENLPSGKDGYYITDLDAVIRQRTKTHENLMILEKKSRNAVCSDSQNITLQILNFLVELGVQASKGKVPILHPVSGKRELLKVKFYGTHLLQLSDEKFKDSILKFDRQLVSTSRIIDILTFGDTNYKQYQKKAVAKVVNLSDYQRVK